MQPFIPEKPGRSSQSRVPSPPRLVSVKRHHGSSDCCSISQKKNKKKFFVAPHARLRLRCLLYFYKPFQLHSGPAQSQRCTNQGRPIKHHLLKSQYTHTRVCVRAHTLYPVEYSQAHLLHQRDLKI